MACHNVLHNGKPESGTFNLAAAAFIDAVKALAEPGQVLLRNPVAIIGVSHPDLRVAGAGIRLH